MADIRANYYLRKKERRLHLESADFSETLSFRCPSLKVSSPEGSLLLSDAAWGSDVRLGSSVRVYIAVSEMGLSLFSTSTPPEAKDMGRLSSPRGATPGLK